MMFMMISSFYPALVFLMTSSALLSLSCSSYMMFWALMELNMLSFLGVMSMNFSKSNKGEGMVYLIIQGVSSIFILSGLMLIPQFSITLSDVVIMFFILMKLGASPLHFWYFWIIENISWDMFFYISTIQKLLPLMFLSFLSHSLLTMFAYLSAFTGVVGGIFSKKLTFLLGYSSLLMLGWFLPLSYNVLGLLFVFLTYTLNLMVVTLVLEESKWENFSGMSVKFWSYTQGLNLSVGMFSFMGVPVTLGFMGKLYGLMILLGQSMLLVLALLLSSGAILWMYTTILFNSWKQFSLSSTLNNSSAQFPWFILLILPSIFIF